MSDYNLLLNSFNKLAEEFMDKMIEFFPYEAKIRGYKITFLTTKKFNNRKPVELFMDSLRPFGYQIVSRDEEFFKQDEYVDTAQNISGKMGLVEHWDNLDDNSKGAIWEYVQSLYMIGMNVLGYKEELKSIMDNYNETVKVT